MNGLRRPTTARMVRVAAMALFVCVCSATAASAATLHTAKQAALQPIKPNATRLSLPQNLAPPASGLTMPGVPNDFATQAAGTNTSLGAGQLVSGELLTASTTFTVPGFSCFLNNDNEIFAPGLFIYDSNGFLQGYMIDEQYCESGSSFSVDFICSNTTCSSAAVPNPGDVLNAVYEQDSTNSQLVLFNRTQGTELSAPGTALLGGGYVFAGDLGPSEFCCGFAAVPNFTKVPYSITTFDGFDISDVLPLRLNLQTSTDVQIKTSAAKTTTFSTSWVHNY